MARFHQVLSIELCPSRRKKHSKNYLHRALSALMTEPALLVGRPKLGIDN